jgi:hypothetical protein
MNANLFEQNRAAQLNQAMVDYKNAKQNYQRLVRQAVSEQDTTKRGEALRALEAENKRLVTIVEGLVQALSEGDLQNTGYSQNTVDDLNAEIANYKEEIEYMRGKNDKVIQLRELLASLSQESSSDRKQYYGYIVGILVLLIVVFVFFVYSYAASVFSAVAEVVSAPIEAVTE